MTRIMRTPPVGLVVVSRHTEELYTCQRLSSAALWYRLGHQLSVLADARYL